jgi:glycosyltransferase involved in cell wall biosynthesis
VKKLTNNNTDTFQKSDPKKKTIVIISTNSFEYDIRVPKLISTLTGKYHVILINWNRYGMKRGNEDQKNFTWIQFNAKIRNSFGLAFLYPAWFLFVSWQLMTREWDSVYSINYQSQIPALVMGKLKKKLIVFELLDLIELSEFLPNNIRNTFLRFDKMLMKHSDAVIAVDEMQITGLEGIPNDNVRVIYDSVPVALLPENQRDPAQKKFTLFYAGVLIRNRRLNLSNLFQAVLDIPDVRVIIAGNGDLVEEVRQWEESYPDKITFIGKISYSEVIRNGVMSDLFFVLRDSTILSNKYTCGSTIFNAMICGKPLLANKDSSTARIVSKEHCGIIVDANNISDIRKAIITLKDNPELCKILGENAKKAYEHTYSWDRMEEKLLRFYDTMFSLRE